MNTDKWRGILAGIFDLVVLALLLWPLWEVISR